MSNLKALSFKHLASDKTCARGSKQTQSKTELSLVEIYPESQVICSHEQLAASPGELYCSTQGLDYCEGMTILRKEKSVIYHPLCHLARTDSKYDGNEVAWQD